jgi:hypothetical protein
MTKSPYGTLKDSIGPELWKYTKIAAKDKPNCLASLTKVTDRESWFEYRAGTPGFSALYNPTSITSTDDFRQ